MELANKTQYAAKMALLQDRDGRDLLVVIVKCTFSLNGNSDPIPAQEQVPVQMTDSFYGEPGKSSVLYESDLAPHKAGTDIVMLGNAYAPKGVARELDVSLRVGPLSKVCRVFGNRRWRKMLGQMSISDPEPFDRMPLVYERAFGGADLSSPDETQHDSEKSNPVGCGFVAVKSNLEVDQLPLPNIEDPKVLIKSPQDRPKPAGFGFIGRHWHPRISYAGTYDRKWNEDRSPLLPLDFDERYYNGAHPDLISGRYLQGGEPVDIVNASPQGNLRFSLPGTRPGIEMVLTSLDRTRLEPVFDTLVLEPDRSRVIMTWRASKIVYRELHKIACVRVFENV